MSFSVNENSFGYKLQNGKIVKVKSNQKHGHFKPESSRMSQSPSIFNSGNKLYGGSGNDTLLSIGGRGDKLYGGSGDDTLASIFGKNNSLYGGRGDDSLISANDYNNGFNFGDFLQNMFNN